MRLLIALLGVFAIQGAGAQNARPSEESIGRLFEVMHTRGLLDSYMGQIDTTMHNSMHEALRGRTLNPEQQQIMDDWSREMTGLIRQEVNWEALRPMMIAVYRDTFTQREIDGMLRFYGSPTGQAVIAKLPQTLQKSMEFMQERIGKLMPQIAQLQKDTMQAMQRAQARAGGVAASTAPQQPAPPPQPASPQPASPQPASPQPASPQP